MPMVESETDGGSTARRLEPAGRERAHGRRATVRARPRLGAGSCAAWGARRSRSARSRCCCWQAGFRLVPLEPAGRRGRAATRCRRDRGAHRGRLAHHRCDRAARRRPRQAPVDQRRQPGDHLGRDFAPQPRLRPDRQLLRRFRSFAEHARQRDRDQALGAEPRVPLADRGHVELPHAARHRGDRPSASGRGACSRSR